MKVECTEDVRVRVGHRGSEVVLVVGAEVKISHRLDPVHVGRQENVA